MLGFFSVVIMLVVAYAYFVEGVLTAFLMFCNVVGAGVVAFSFWEPLADLMDPAFQGSFLEGYEDAFCLLFLFTLILMALRTVTNLLDSTFVEYNEVVQRGGGAIFGILTGYLVTGFMVVVMQTLPLYENFVGFNARYDPANESSLRKILPPDRAWLAAMKWASGHAFATGDDSETFDPGASFELRYARYRRYDDDRKHPFPVPYFGEFETELHRH